MAQRKGRPRGLTPDGPKVRSLRVGLGLSTAQLAERVGLHPQSVRHAEKGRRISDVYASRLARVLGVSMRDITDWTGDDIESEPEPKVPAA
jgi:transcriptional regulator with XRE-family HTH domain